MGEHFGFSEDDLKQKVAEAIEERFGKLLFLEYQKAPLRRAATEIGEGVASVVAANNRLMAKQFDALVLRVESLEELVEDLRQKTKGD